MTFRTQNARLLVSLFAGIGAIVLHAGFAVVAYALYPSSFSPTQNWLSDLGNTNLNPDGAVFYRLGTVLAGSALFVFFSGLSAWPGHYEARVRIYLSATQALGLIAAIAFIMTGVFSEDDFQAHLMWTVVSFMCFGASAAFAGLAWLHYPNIANGFSYFAFAVAFFDVLPGYFHGAYWLEWLVVTLLAAYVAVLAYLTRSVTKPLPGSSSRQPYR